MTCRENDRKKNAVQKPVDCHNPSLSVSFGNCKEIECLILDLQEVA
jgi:hypothetical protein